MLFQQQLGALRDRTDRIQALAGWIADQIGADVNHAALVPGPALQCDLMTSMILPVSQTPGVMGMRTTRVTMVRSGRCGRGAERAVSAARTR